MSRLRAGACFIAMFLSASAYAATHEEDQSEINLAVGGQKVINSTGVNNFSEPSGIVQIKTTDDGRRMVISAVRPGSTTLLLIYGSGKQETININVYARSPQAIRTELKTLLAGLTGVDIREVGGRVFLDGAVPSQDDLARIDRIVALYAGQVASLVTVDPARQRTNIKLDLHFVQFRKNSSHKFGVNWPANIGSHLGATNQPSVSFLYTYDFVLRAATRFEARRAGTIAVITSVAGVRGRASNFVYGSAKSLVSTLLEGLRHRMHGRGVAVVDIRPGFVDTPMTAAFPKGPLWAAPGRVARDIVRAVDRGAGVAYTPWFWRWIMLVVRHIPEPVFVRTKL